MQIEIDAYRFFKTPLNNLDSKCQMMHIFFLPHLKVLGILGATPLTNANVPTFTCKSGSYHGTTYIQNMRVWSDIL